MSCHIKDSKRVTFDLYLGPEILPEGDRPPPYPTLPDRVLSPIAVTSCSISGSLFVRKHFSTYAPPIVSEDEIRISIESAKNAKNTGPLRKLVDHILQNPPFWESHPEATHQVMRNFVILSGPELFSDKKHLALLRTCVRMAFNTAMIPTSQKLLRSRQFSFLLHFLLLP
jgi:hypothetical protein